MLSLLSPRSVSEVIGVGSLPSAIQRLRCFYWRYILKEAVKLIGFILVAIGFLGLVINEFVLGQERCITIAFAIINAAGLITLAIAHWGTK